MKLSTVSRAGGGNSAASAAQRSVRDDAGPSVDPGALARGAGGAEGAAGAEDVGSEPAVPLLPGLTPAFSRSDVAETGMSSAGQS